MYHISATRTPRVKMKLSNLKKLESKNKTKNRAIFITPETAGGTYTFCLDDGQNGWWDNI